MKYLFKRMRQRIQMFVSGKFIPLWVKLLDYVRKILMLFTFLCMVVGILFVAYHLFICYDFLKVIATSIFLLTMVSVNHALQE